MPESAGEADVAQGGGRGSIEARRRAVGAFAIAESAMLEACWQRIGAELGARPVRGPEVGLVMLRGRMGGGGAAFNLGEASVTRATIRLGSGALGHAMILGRDLDKARLAACLDAAWQEGRWRGVIETGVIVPALAARIEEDVQRAEETEATRVDFFTVVRGEDR